MDLNRKLLAGEKIFDQKFRIAAVRHLKPDFTDRLIAIHRVVECRPERSTPPWLFHPAHPQPGVGNPTLTFGIEQFAATCCPFGPFDKAVSKLGKPWGRGK